MEPLASKQLWRMVPGELVWLHTAQGDRVTVYRNGSCWQVFYRKVGPLTTAHHDGDVIKTAAEWGEIKAFLAGMGIAVI